MCYCWLMCSKKFRNSSLKNYGLCPSHYLSATTLNWDTMLSVTKVAHEIISNAEFYLFFEKGIREGVSYISKKYSKINNNYLKSYAIQQELKHIIHLHTNSLCGCAMSKFLPINGFKWTDPKEFGMNKYTGNCSKGCVLLDS